MRHNGLKYDTFEDLVALVRQGGQRVDLHIETIEVLEKALHPPNHNNVVLPFLVQFLQKLLPIAALFLR